MINAAEITSKIPRPRLLSAEIYDAMIKSGILTENDNVELLNGAIIEKMPKGNRHSYFNDFISDWLNEKLNGAAIVRNQNPILLDDFSKPEPDIVLCRLPRQQYLNRTPTPEDILLIIEVSDSALYFDRHEKGLAFARAGIGQYLLVNVENNTVEDYRNPNDDGYGMKQTYRAGDKFSLLAFPEIEIAVEDFLQG